MEHSVVVSTDFSMLLQLARAGSSSPWILSSGANELHEVQYSLRPAELGAGRPESGQVTMQVHRVTHTVRGDHRYHCQHLLVGNLVYMHVTYVSFNNQADLKYEMNKCFGQAEWPSSG
jgi:hypothetical protein